MKRPNSISLKTVILVPVFCLISFLQTPLPVAQGQQTGYTDFLEMAQAPTAETPRYALSQFKTEFNPQIHASNMEYLKSHPDLLEKIRLDLGGQDLKWQLEGISQRLLYAPENRPDYARRYESFCREIIGEVLDVLDLQTPYTQIVTLTPESSPLETSDGFTAYIVHDLALDYRARYEFSNTSKKAVGIELTGQYDTGEVGSYTSELSFDDNGDIIFIHNTYTVWQNNAQNPYTVLMTPVEETLHYLLRNATETAIQATILEREDCTQTEAETIVADWISIEEAIVGGLVHHLILPILEQRIGPIPETLVSDDLAAKTTFEKYGKLGKGIRLVDEMGCKACLDLYLKDPQELKVLLQG
jgi:hypothetical protein